MSNVETKYLTEYDYITTAPPEQLTEYQRSMLAALREDEIQAGPDAIEALDRHVARGYVRLSRDCTAYDGTVYRKGYKLEVGCRAGARLMAYLPPKFEKKTSHGVAKTVRVKDDTYVLLRLDCIRASFKSDMDPKDSDDGESALGLPDPKAAESLEPSEGTTAEEEIGSLPTCSVNPEFLKLIPGTIFEFFRAP